MDEDEERQRGVNKGPSDWESGAERPVLGGGTELDSVGSGVLGAHVPQATDRWV